MKVSIITVSYNSAKTIEDTITSVLAQTYPNIEYIIIDGGSTDRTQSIVRSHGKKITQFISEPDRGIYDAMNKGILRATGDIIGIINSDDMYADPTVLERVVESMTEGVAGCYGNITYVNQNNDTIVRLWKADVFAPWKLLFGWIPPHPGVFLRKEVYKQCGLFDTSFKIAADYELLLRILKRYKMKLQYVDQNMVFMREGGHSANSFRQRIRGWKELCRAWKVNGFVCPPWLVIARVVSKLHQYRVKKSNVKEKMHNIH